MHLLSVLVTPANEQERAQVAQLTKEVQEVTGENVQIAFVDQGYTGESPSQATEKNGIPLCVVKLDEAKRGFVLLPRRCAGSSSVPSDSSPDFEGWLETMRGSPKRS